MANIERYSFQMPDLPAPQAVAQPGKVQGVLFTVEAEQLDWIIDKIEGWFDDRDEITLVDYGQSDKQEVGIALLEWEGFEIDPLFLAILRDEDIVLDYCVYDRPEG
jgi:hypothetical protein